MRGNPPYRSAVRSSSPAISAMLCYQLRKIKNCSNLGAEKLRNFIYIYLGTVPVHKKLITIEKQPVPVQYRTVPVYFFITFLF
jgi:hypothetical protein